MTVEIKHHTSQRYVEIDVNGKLTASDYETFVPMFERLIEEHGKIRLLIVLEDFHGWDAAALWQDLKFDFKHFDDFERIAFVGEKAWEKGMAAFCKPFTTARVRFFSKPEEAEGRSWLART